MRAIHIPAQPLANPIYGSDFQSARDYFFNPFRLEDENDGEKGEPYHRVHLHYVIIDSENNVIKKTKGLTPLMNQMAMYRDQNNDYEMVVIYSKVELDPDGYYQPVIRMPLIKALMFFQYTR